MSLRSCTKQFTVTKLFCQELRKIKKYLLEILVTFMCIQNNPQSLPLTTGPTFHDIPPVGLRGREAQTRRSDGPPARRGGQDQQVSDVCRQHDGVSGTLRPHRPRQARLPPGLSHQDSEDPPLRLLLLQQVTGDSHQSKDQGDRHEVQGTAQEENDSHLRSLQGEKDLRGRR